VQASLRNRDGLLEVTFRGERRPIIVENVAYSDFMEALDRLARIDAVGAADELAARLRGCLRGLAVTISWDSLAEAIAGAVKPVGEGRGEAVRARLERSAYAKQAAIANAVIETEKIIVWAALRADVAVEPVGGGRAELRIRNVDASIVGCQCRREASLDVKDRIAEELRRSRGVARRFWVVKSMWLKPLACALGVRSHLALWVLFDPRDWLLPRPDALEEARQLGCPTLLPAPRKEPVRPPDIYDIRILVDMLLGGSQRES
jgi:hypothetical protein